MSSGILALFSTLLLTSNLTRCDPREVEAPHNHVRPQPTLQAATKEADVVGSDASITTTSSETPVCACFFLGFPLVIPSSSSVKANPSLLAARSIEILNFLPPHYSLRHPKQPRQSCCSLRRDLSLLSCCWLAFLGTKTSRNVTEQQEGQELFFCAILEPSSSDLFPRAGMWGAS